MTENTEAGKAPAQNQNSEAKSKEEDDLNLDFSGLKQKITGLFSSKKTSEEPTHPHSTHSSHPESHHDHPHQVHHHPSQKEEELSLDFTSAITFGKKHAKWLIPLACILIALFASVYLRTMPLRMPVAEDWAANTVYNFYKTNIGNQVSQQYPNLPAQNRNSLVDKEWQKFYDGNKERLKQEISQVANQYRAQFQDDSGTLYLLGIDPWHFYRMTEYAVNNGYPGSELKDGEPWDAYRLAPLGTSGVFIFHTWFGMAWHKFVNLFTTMPLMATFFWVGVIFSALSVIPAFFIGKRISGNNVGGFFTALLMAVSAFFVQRTTGESSDTDVYVVFFPLLIIWLFLEALEAKELKKKLVWGSLAGISTGIFLFAWSGWWYVFDFILATVGIYLLYTLAKNYQNISETLRSSDFLNTIYLTITYFVTTWIVTSFFDNVKAIFDHAVLGPLGFINIKAVAVNSVWPNILTTVAELNVVPLEAVISQLGGKLLFALAIVGVLLTFLKKDENGNRDIKVPVLLAIWFVASLYATTKGVRFTLQATPVFAIAFGAFLGIVWHYASQWVSKELKLDSRITKVIFFLLLAILLIEPVKAGYAQAYGSVPSMNDGWYNTLLKIKAEAPADAIITSWWDFGYWFRAIANRAVTFDGGTQVEWGAHWVGNSLLNNEEKSTIGIIRMLNCGQNTAFDELHKIFNDTPKEVALLHQIIVQDKSEAIKTLKDAGLTTEQIASVIKYTHCDARPDYYITSSDMIGKAGVWGHFGSWDFNKAVMYQQTKDKTQEEAVAYLTKKFNFTAEQATQLHSQIQSTPADSWIAPWPNYISGINPCETSSEKELLCNVGTSQGTITLSVNLENKSAIVKTNNPETVVHPDSLVYADKEGIKEKKFSSENNQQILGFSAVLIPQGESGGVTTYGMMLTDPALGASTFTKLYFFNGHGMKCFSKFDDVNSATGGMVATWKVDYECKQKNQVFFLPKEEVQAAHLLITLNNRTEEEAKALIDKIKAEITTQNFAEYAKKYSEDPGSKNYGGELGWFGKGIMVPEFEKAAFAVNSGEISQPIKSQFGWHLIWVKEKRTS